jgi:hypothetical protein
MSLNYLRFNKIVIITYSGNVWHLSHFALWDLDRDENKKVICITTFNLDLKGF